MPYIALEKKINNLTLEQQQSVYDYVNFLLYQNTAQKNIRRKPGGLEGKFYMAEDFDKTPECFKDYV
ncbi:DUF2281 domain-containing protein [Treponema denticola]|uniref:DUF2281 domain-containing protein n=1 Tax=Treponema denticola TaxID=158 RepID=UPI0020A2BD03|nr:DUF2281 domain-containing protein [Treponema denticola]UTC83612.1 DUF2281 domain-containing protein [Treponema denticola]